MKYVKIACLVCWLPFSTAFATVMIPKTSTDLTAQADVIFLGRVDSHVVALQTMPIIGRMPVTTYTVAVREVLKGDLTAGAPFQFTQAGGTLPPGAVPSGSGMVMAPRGAPIGYDDGREYLLFLQHLPNGLWAPVGAMQGQFTVHTNADGSKSLINALSVEIATVPNATASGGATTAKNAAPSAGEHEIPLDHVRTIVRSVTAPGAGGATPRASVTPTNPTPTVAPSMGH